MNGTGANVAGCGDCAGKCCRSYRVRVHAGDVRALVAGTGLRPSDFIWLVEDPASGFRLRPGGPTMDLHLQRRSETGACVFLMEIAPDKARCGVYAHRPLVCSNFPTTLLQGAVAIRQETVCGRDTWNLAAMDLPSYRRGHVRDMVGWTEHERIVQAWNASVDASGKEATADQLFDHLQNLPAEA